MRLTKAIRAEIADKLTRNKFTAKVAAARAQAVAAYVEDDDVQQLRMLATTFGNAAFSPATTDFINTQVPSPCGMLSLRSDTKVKRRQINIELQLPFRIATPADVYGFYRTLAKRAPISAAVGNLFAMGNDILSFHHDVSVFLGQFNTVKQCRAEWSDIDNYVNDKPKPKNPKNPHALVLTGAAFKKMLK